MTTTDTSFVATGWPGRIGSGSPAANVGFYANAQAPFGGSRAPFKLGALAVGHQVGVYGAVDDIAIPPGGAPYDEAGVVGTSNNKHGVFGFSSTRCGVMGQWGDKPALVLSSSPPPAADGVMGLARNVDGVVGASDKGVSQIG